MEQLITIIIPIFNGKELIQPTLSSILNQTYTNFEIIFVDDASVDSSIKIIELHKKKDKRIRLIKTIGQGFSFARNLALKAAKGDYIMFFEVGNLMSANLLEYLIKIIEDNNCQIAMCNHFDIPEPDFYNYTVVPPKQEKENLEILDSKKYLDYLSTRDMHTFAKITSIWNKLIKKSIIKNINFNEEKYYGDKFAIFDLFKEPIKIVSSNQILIGNGLIDEHFTKRCFAYHNLEEIEFLQKTLLYFKNSKNSIGIKNTSLKLLQLLYDIRVKLDNYFTDIYDLEEQKQNINQKFSSIRKFLITHYPEESEICDKISTKYKKLLDDENFRKKYYFLFPSMPIKFQPFDLPYIAAEKFKKEHHLRDIAPK